MTDVFISYSRKDIAFARLLHEALVENGLETWIDWQDIPPSADWLAEVYVAIEEADAFVFIISETSLASEICGLEMAHAAEHNKRLIPIVIKDVEAEKVPKELSVLNWIFFDDAGEKFAEAMEDLVTAITVDQVWVKGHTRFENRALEWERKDRNRSLLLRGTNLGEGEVWLGSSAGKDLQPTALQTEFILKSREDATRRGRLTLLGVGGALVVSIGLGILAWTQRNVAVSEGQARATAQAEAEIARDTAEQEADARATQQAIAEAQTRTAQSRELASLASNLFSTELDLGTLLAIESYQKEENYLSEGSVLQSLQSQSRLVRIFHPGAEPHPVRGIKSIVVHPSGEYLISLDDDRGFTNETKLIRFIDIATGEDVRDPIPLTGSMFPKLIRVSLDGNKIATFRLGEIQVWRIDTSELILTVPTESSHQPDYTFELAFSPDSQYLTSTLDQGHIKSWRFSDGSLVFDYQVDRASKFSYSPDGKFLVGLIPGEIVLLDSMSGEKMGSIDLPVRIGNNDEVNLQISPDGDYFALTVGTVVLYYSFEEGQFISTVNSTQLEDITGIKFSTLTDSFFTISPSRTLMWDATTGEFLGRI